MIHRLITFMALLGSSVKCERDAVPAPCPSDEITYSDCSRTISSDLGVSGKISFTYWGKLIDNVPTFHAHYELEARKATDGSEKSYQELRLCVEIGKEG